jgi:hypothetical protein
MTELADPPSFRMPPVVAHETMQDLLKFLQDHRGMAIRIDGAAVVRPGAQFLQLLTVAARTWRADDMPLILDDPSGAIAASSADLGFTNATAVEECS